QALRELPPGTPVVVDPVMVAESGARLLQADAQRALVQEILPQATVVTPNVPEARVLAGWESASADGGVGREATPAPGGEGSATVPPEGDELTDAQAVQL